MWICIVWITSRNGTDTAITQSFKTQDQCRTWLEELEESKPPHATIGNNVMYPND